MSVRELIEGMKELSISEMNELYYAFERQYLMLSSHEASKRWAGKKLEIHSPSVAAEPKRLPKLVFMDLRADLPMPKRPTTEELEELRP